MLCRTVAAVERRDTPLSHQADADRLKGYANSAPFRSHVLDSRINAGPTALENRRTELKAEKSTAKNQCWTSALAIKDPPIQRDFFVEKPEKAIGMRQCKVRLSDAPISGAEPEKAKLTASPLFHAIVRSMVIRLLV
jgi:hypothetical protein